MRSLAITCAALAALCAPALARAGDVAMRVQVLPDGARSLAGASESAHFNMLAFKWKGSGSILFRWHRLHGRWSGWEAADDDPTWTGGSGSFQIRRVGTVHDVRAYELWSRVLATSTRSLAEAGSPSIVTRAGWDADEEIVRAKPVYAPALRLAIVHHTANANNYTRAQAPAIVRGIEEYHVEGNGWNDIGYNFLIDRFGNVYEGRAGGITRNVVGAHAEGFNTGTVGVSLIGNFATVTPPKAMQDALVKLLAWRLDVAHIDPLSTVVYASGGNAKFKAGKLVTLRAISGHRDTGPTECPGNAAYAILPAIAKRVAETGLPKLYSPTVAGTLGGTVRFEARLSASAAWTVTVASQTGAVVARGRGTGTNVDWTWTATAAKGAYTWTISAPGTRPATGTIGTPRRTPIPPTGPSLTNVTNDPLVMTVGADGTMPTAHLSFTLGSAATVLAQVEDATTNAVVAQVLDAPAAAGRSTVPWDPSGLAAGRYRVVVTATVGSKSVTRWVDVIVDRTLTGFTATPPIFSPNADGVDDTTTFSFTLASSATVELDIDRGNAIVATVFSGALPAGQSSIAWDGTGFGVLLPDGVYEAVAKVTDGLGVVPFTIPVTIQTQPPGPPG